LARTFVTRSPAPRRSRPHSADSLLGRRRGRLRGRGRLGEGCGAGPGRRGRPPRLPDAGRRATGTRPRGGPPPVQQPPPPAGPAAGGTRSRCRMEDGDVAHAVILG